MAVPKLKVSCNISTVYIVDTKEIKLRPTSQTLFFASIIPNCVSFVTHFIRWGQVLPVQTSTLTFTGADAIFIHSGRILEGKT